MKYDKEYARKVFELIPEAEFVAVDEDGTARWSEGKMNIDGFNMFWSYSYLNDSGELGKVECDDWQNSLIARGDVKFGGSEKSAECWASFGEDGLITAEDVCIGVVNGLDFRDCDQIMDELSESIMCALPDNVGRAGQVYFKITNLYHASGQMSHPETGQWDFPPHFEYDIEIISVEYCDGACCDDI